MLGFLKKDYDAKERFAGCHDKYHLDVFKIPLIYKESKERRPNFNLGSWRLERNVIFLFGHKNLLKKYKFYDN